MKITILYVGKAKDAAINRVAADFVERSTHYARIEQREFKPGKSEPWDGFESWRRIGLDPAGKSTDSAGFTALVAESELHARDLVFLIGGADGLLPEWKASAHQLMSLSPMTFPHEMARAMLTEQIYRAFTTLRGHPYPR